MTNMEISKVFWTLTKQQRQLLLHCPYDGWFPVTWEGFRGLFKSLQKLKLTHLREPGMQVLSGKGREFQQYARMWYGYE
jgi:hypothetical protein